MDSFNANFKKQRESLINQISNKAHDTIDNIDIEGITNFSKKIVHQ